MMKKTIFSVIFFLFFTLSLVYSGEDDFSEFNDPEDGSPMQLILDAEKNREMQQEAEKIAKDEIKHKPIEKLIDNTREEIVNEEQKSDEEIIVETEEEVSGDLQDSDEFEGFEKESSTGKPDLKIAEVPQHLTSSWENYYLEIVMLAGLLVYMANFIKGKNKNARLATAWLDAHRELLESNFSLIGDDGQQNPIQGVLNKESENVYNLWCSGRVACEGMLVEIKLLKRQDLLSFISRLMRPATDQITVKVILDESEMEGFVMCISNKKKVNALLKDYQDLATFCLDRRVLKNVIPDSFMLLSEINEASMSIIDAKVQRIFKEFEDNIEYMHISDQFTGLNGPQDDQQSTRLPEIKKCLVFGFKVGNKGATNVQNMEAIRPLLSFVLYMVDKVRRVKLGKEAKLKSEKNRQKAMDTYEKSVHLQRQEAAQQRRVEKMRVEKEKLMAEEDPDKARKLEISNQKKEAKYKQPRMKMMKIKS